MKNVTMKRFIDNGLRLGVVVRQSSAVASGNVSCSLNKAVGKGARTVFLDNGHSGDDDRSHVCMTNI